MVHSFIRTADLNPTYFTVNSDRVLLALLSFLVVTKEHFYEG